MKSDAAVKHHLEIPIVYPINEPAETGNRTWYGLFFRRCVQKLYGVDVDINKDSPPASSNMYPKGKDISHPRGSHFLPWRGRH